MKQVMINSTIDTKEYQRAVSELRILLEMVEIQSMYFNKVFGGKTKMSFNRFMNSKNAFIKDVNKLAFFDGAEDIIDGVAGDSLSIMQHVWKSKYNLDEVLEKLS